jgi:hypothetical protein
MVLNESNPCEKVVVFINKAEFDVYVKNGPRIQTHTLFPTICADGTDIEPVLIVPTVTENEVYEKVKDLFYKFYFFYLQGEKKGWVDDCIQRLWVADKRGSLQ